MSDFNPSPYRGDANIGHVSEDLFRMYFVGSNVRIQHCFCTFSYTHSCNITFVMQLALAFGMLPGRILGSEVRPRKYK